MTLSCCSILFTCCWHNDIIKQQVWSIFGIVFAVVLAIKKCIRQWTWRTYLSVPWRDLSRENVPYGLPFWSRFGIRLNGMGYPFKNNCHPFKWLWLSVREKLSSVRTARAIHLKKIVIRWNSLGYPFEKIVIRSNGSGYLFEKEFVDRSSDWSYLFK